MKYYPGIDSEVMKDIVRDRVNAPEFHKSLGLRFIVCFAIVLLALIVWVCAC